MQPADSAESLGMKTGQQRHRDKDKCRRRQGKYAALVIISPRTYPVGMVILPQSLRDQFSSLYCDGCDRLHASPELTLGRCWS
jgi:hypothetical protein